MSGDEAPSGVGAEAGEFARVGARPAVHPRFIRHAPESSSARLRTAGST
jgi:hypothetical protein